MRTMRILAVGFFVALSTTAMAQDGRRPEPPRQPNHGMAHSAKGRHVELPRRMECSPKHPHQMPGKSHDHRMNQRPPQGHCHRAPAPGRR